jgi:hypothetical protein
MAWAGLENSPTVDEHRLPEGARWDKSANPTRHPSLAVLNDSDTPYSVIADIIDQQL